MKTRKLQAIWDDVRSYVSTYAEPTMVEDVDVCQFAIDTEWPGDVLPKFTFEAACRSAALEADQRGVPVAVYDGGYPYRRCLIVQPAATHAVRRSDIFKDGRDCLVIPTAQ